MHCFWLSLSVSDTIRNSRVYLSQLYDILWNKDIYICSSVIIEHATWSYNRGIRKFSWHEEKAGKEKTSYNKKEIDKERKNMKSLPRREKEQCRKLEYWEKSERERERERDMLER